MKKTDFWKHIESTKRADPEEHEERLVRRLSKLSPSETMTVDELIALIDGRKKLTQLSHHAKPQRHVQSAS